MAPEGSARRRGGLDVSVGAPLDPTARRLVVGDLHGDWPTLLRLLRHVGAITDDGERLPGWWLAQLGDLIQGGQPSADDERCLAEGLRLFDVLLLGTHELPHAYGGAGFPSFLGRGPLLPAALDALAAAVVAGRFQVAAAVDGWLLTHAGVHPTMQERLALPSDAAACATVLTDRFIQRLRCGTPDPLCAAVGQARGRPPNSWSAVCRSPRSPLTTNCANCIPALPMASRGRSTAHATVSSIRRPHPPASLLLAVKAGISSLCGSRRPISALPTSLRSRPSSPFPMPALSWPPSSCSSRSPGGDGRLLLSQRRRL